MSATTTLIIPCEDACMFAKGDDCECFCGGVNHKQGHRLTAVQRKVVRTKAGRRVTPFTKGTPDWKLGRQWTSQHDAGMLKKDIAEQYGVSQPTVRRFITRYLLTEALTAKAAQKAAKAA